MDIKYHVRRWSNIENRPIKPVSARCATLGEARAKQRQLMKEYPMDVYVVTRPDGTIVWDEWVDSEDE